MNNSFYCIATDVKESPKSWMGDVENFVFGKESVSDMCGHIYNVTESGENPVDAKEFNDLVSILDSILDRN